MIWTIVNYICCQLHFSHDLRNKVGLTKDPTDLMSPYRCQALYGFFCSDDPTIGLVFG